MDIKFHFSGTSFRTGIWEYYFPWYELDNLFNKVSDDQNACPPRQISVSDKSRDITPAAWSHTFSGSFQDPEAQRIGVKVPSTSI